MSPATRALALRAAAKVTMFGALCGCENAPQVSPPTTSVTETNNPPAPDPTVAPSADPPVVAAGRCGSNPSKANLKCCADLVDGETADGGAVKSGDALGCCKLLVADNDRGMLDGGGQEFRERWPCCQALQWQSSGTCTPWGPPVPPPMDWGGSA